MAPDIFSKFSSIQNFETLPSSNDYLLERDICNPTLCLAKTQTAGKGRLGRRWHSPPGENLYFSLYWKFNKNISELTGLPLVVGISIMEALSSLHTLPPGVGIKWPNDLEYEGAKWGGILIETHRNQGMVIGVGLNLKISEREIGERRVTDLEEILGTSIAREVFLMTCLEKLVTNFEEIESKDVSGILSSRWSQYDILRGKKRMGGIVEGINGRGELLLRVGKIIKTICSGEILE